MKGKQHWPTFKFKNERVLKQDAKQLHRHFADNYKSFIGKFEICSEFKRVFKRRLERNDGEVYLKEVISINIEF